MKKNLVKMCLVVMILIGTGCLQACGRVGAGPSEAENSKQQQETQEKDADMQENDVGLQERKAGLQEEMSGQQMPEQQGGGTEAALKETYIKSSSFWEDDGFIYALGSRQISKVNVDSRETTVLWENWETGEERRFNLYAQGGGILYGDKLYFFETEDGEAAVSVIRTDGTGYKKLKSIDSAYGYKMYLEDNTLYIYHKWGFEGEGYDIAEDGSLGEEKREFPYRRIFDESEYSIGGFNREYLLTVDNFYSEEEKALYLTDISLKETKFLASCSQNINIIDMDEEFLYFIQSDKDKKEYIYKKISLEKGEEEEIFRQEAQEWMADSYWSPDTVMNLSVQNGYFYYPQEENYRIYAMRRKLADAGKSEKVGEAYYDSGIADIGRMEKIQEKIYSKENEEVVIYEEDISYLTVDKRFQGADRINSILYENEVENIYTIPLNIVEEMEKEVKEYGGCISWSYESKPSRIYFFDGRYFSFYQDYYIFTGGAHGMPYWTGYTFDLQTGEELFLNDIISNSEEELKEIVTGYFTELIAGEPGGFWEDAPQYVEENTDFESLFYLTKEGIVFYFGPYELSCYAAGFQQVTIPYSEFEMKIDLSADNLDRE